MFEITSSLVINFLLPILLSTMMKKGYFDWNEKWIRIGLVIIFIWLTASFLLRTDVRDYVMRLHPMINNIGYLVCFVLGGALCGYWYFTGNIIKVPTNAPPINLKQPTLPIAPDIAKALKKEIAPQIKGNFTTLCGFNKILNIFNTLTN